MAISGRNPVEQITRPARSAPDQTETDNSMMFIIAKPETAIAFNSSRASSPVGIGDQRLVGNAAAIQNRVWHRSPPLDFGNGGHLWQVR